MAMIVPKKHEVVSNWITLYGKRLKRFLTGKLAFLGLPVLKKKRRCNFRETHSCIDSYILDQAPKGTL